MDGILRCWMFRRTLQSSVTDTFKRLILSQESILQCHKETLRGLDKPRPRPPRLILFGPNRLPRRNSMRETITFSPITPCAPHRVVGHYTRNVTKACLENKIFSNSICQIHQSLQRFSSQYTRSSIPRTSYLSCSKMERLPFTRALIWVSLLRDTFSLDPSYLFSSFCLPIYGGHLL